MSQYERPTGLTKLATGRTTYNQAANAVTTVAVPVALGVFSGTLLTDALTALSVLYTRADTTLQLVNRLIDDSQSAGMAD